MTKAKLDKIKRMKTIHVWPAILGFLLSLGLLVGLVMACVSVALLYVLENEYSKKYEAVAYISDLVEEDYRNNISFEESLEKINRDQICIINPQNEILAGKGDIDIEFTSELEVDIVQNRTFYSGVEENLEWFDEDGEISPDIIALVSKMTEQPYYGEEWIEDILYSVDCWMVYR